jgi:hypothetical protein
MPADARYFTWSFTDRMFVTLDGMNVRTRINRKQAKVDPDGMACLVVSRNDPGAPNGMETTGYRSGLLPCRSAGSGQAPCFNTGLIPMAEVFEHLAARRQCVTQEA